MTGKEKGIHDVVELLIEHYEEYSETHKVVATKSVVFDLKALLITIKGEK